MTTRETWYVLEDGSFADPREVVTDDKGVIRHKSGAAVALGPHGPKSSGVDVEEQRAKSQPKQKPEAKSKDMKPEDNATRPYRTRESKSE